MSTFLTEVHAMDSNCDVGRLSDSMQACEPFITTGNSCTIEPDVEDTSLVAVFDTSPVLRGDKDKDDVAFNYAPEIPGQEMTCSDSRKNARMGKVNQKAQQSKAMRKRESQATKQTLWNRILPNVERRRRTHLCKTGRSSSWGSLENIDQILIQNLPVDVAQRKHTKSLKGKSVQGSKKKEKSSKVSKQNNYASFARPIRLKVKLGNELDASRLAQSVKENVKQDCLVHKMEILEPKGLCKDIEKGPSLNMPVKVSSFDRQCTHSQIDGEALGVVADNQYLDPGTSPDSEVINLISDSQVDGKAEEVTRHVKISSKPCAALGDVRVLIGKDGKKHQADNCCVDDRLPSSEIRDNVILPEKHENGENRDIYNGEEFSKELFSSSLMESRGSGEDTNCRVGSSVPKKLLVYAKGHKNSKSSKSRIVGESTLGATNSLERQKGKTCKLKGKNGKPVNKKKSKKEGGHSQDVFKIENDHETVDVEGNKSDNLPSVKSRIGNSKEDVRKTGIMSHHASEVQFPPPRNAWVCCDDCLQWRRIAADLADSIEETDCRWTCNDNMDKGYADCSVPQEKSNDEINVELEISDVSCGEDPFNTNSNEHKLCTVAPQQASWTLIKSNLFLHRSRKSQSIDEIMVCHCKLSYDGSKGCGDSCLNRMLNIECVQGTCPCGELCSNQKFQKQNYAKLKWFRCGKKGYGLQVVQDIRRGQFLIEYVGEVLDMHAYEARQREYAAMGHKHFYFMTLNGSEVIDACAKGNLGRFINHSCEPNCQTEKWMVNGEVCIGLFAVRDIKKGEEVTFDYNYVRVFGAAAKRCVCGSSQCRGYIGGDRSNAEVIVQDDSDEEYPEPLMVYKDNEIDDDLRNLLYAPTSFDDVETHAISSKLEVDAGSPKIILEELSTSRPGNLKTLSEDKDEIHKSVSADESLEVMGMTNASNTLTSGSQFSSENSSEKPPKSDQLSGTLLEHDKSQLITCNDLPDFSEKKFSSHLGLTQSSDTSSLTKKGESSSETRVIVKKHKAHVKRSRSALNLKEKTKISSSVVKKGKVKVAKNLDKTPMVDNKSHVVPCKTKKPISSSSNSRFEAVEEKLNELLDSDGGISKRRDSTKGYLKLLLLTAASGYCDSGEATIQSNRDLSMILDALLKTKSRMVLVDIINRNGLQMLHNIMKRYRREFNKTPILRKLLKVLEYLAFREILTMEHIIGGPPRPGVESFRESILSFTEHDDKQVHQIARNFRDRWIPKTIRKINIDDHRLDYHHQGTNCNRYSIRPDWDTKTPTNPIAVSSTEASVVPCSTGFPTKTIRTRKRKSRWDETPEPTTHEDPQNSCSMNIDEDIPPGFSLPSNRADGTPAECSDFVKVLPQGRFNSRLPVSYGIPLPVIQEIGFPQEERPISWVVAPGIPFQPFPPLPPTSSRDKKEHPHCNYKASSNSPSSDSKIACGKIPQPVDFHSLEFGSQQNQKKQCQGFKGK